MNIPSTHTTRFLVPFALAAGLCSAPAVLADCERPVPRDATYILAFESTWSAETHPEDFPRSPHLSGLIGASHDASVSFWSEGALATPGIRSMAETGSKSPLRSEIQSAETDGAVLATIDAGGIGRSPGSVDDIWFEVSTDHPLVTVVTMVAPSPDWFVGVTGVSLFQDGDWVQELVVELPAYDAGTDSGLTYTSPNERTEPAEPVSRITTGPLGAGTPLGRFIFERWEDQPGPGPFLRGDANSDRSVDVSDAVFILRYLFSGGPEPECLEAADVHDRGQIDISSAVFLLGHLFLGAVPPPEPYPACGFISTEDGYLGCRCSPCDG